MIQWDIFRGFVDDMWRTNDFTGLTGWEELGISLGNAVNGLFEKINFGDIAHVLASGFNGAIQTLKNFIATVEWDDVADNITTGLNTMIHETNWEEAGTVLGNAALELLGVFEQVANDTDWEGLGRGIGQFLENIPWGEILQNTFSIIWDVLSGLISGLFDYLLDKYHLPSCSPFQSKWNWNRAVISRCFMLSSVSVLTCPFSRAASRILLL
jgi:hypothetical protein